MARNPAILVRSGLVPATKRPILLKIIDPEVMIGDEGFTRLSGIAQAKAQSLY